MCGKSWKAAAPPTPSPRARTALVPSPQCIKQVCLLSFPSFLPSSPPLPLWLCAVLGVLVFLHPNLAIGLIPVVVWLKGPVLVQAQILGLLVCKLRKMGIECRQM